MIGLGGAEGSLSFWGVDSNRLMASIASSGVGWDLVFANTASKCPFRVGTLWQLAETLIPAGLPTGPRILFVSCSTFDSSFLMKGMTFWSMSREATPGYPAPETACIDETITVSMPNLSSRGLSDSVRIAVVQFGLATINPSHFRRRL